MEKFDDISFYGRENEELQKEWERMFENRKKKKQLLLNDISARLPYGVKFNYGGNDGCDYKAEIISLAAINDSFPIEDCRPYLRPMSSMTEEEKGAFDKFICIDEDAWHGKENGCLNQAKIMSDGIEWLLAHHFDFRGLIEKGLALEAQKGMYEKK